MNKKYQTIFNTAYSFAQATFREILRIDIQTAMVGTGYDFVYADAVFDDKSKWLFRADGTFEQEISDPF